MDGRRVVRAVLLLGETAMMQTARPRDGWTVSSAVLAVSLLSVYPSIRLSAQDTSAIDRGVRIGIIYRPGVRPGLVVLPGPAPALDSARVIIARDLDYSDRFELITLPGGDSIRFSGAAASSLLGRPPTDRKSTRLNSSHLVISYAVFCLKKKKTTTPSAADCYLPQRR